MESDDKMGENLKPKVAVRGLSLKICSVGPDIQVEFLDIDVDCCYHRRYTVVDARGAVAVILAQGCSCGACSCCS